MRRLGTGCARQRPLCLCHRQLAGHLQAVFTCCTQPVAMRRWAVTAVLAIALVGAGVAWAATRGSAASTRYLTATVARGTVAQTVAAVGTVQPGASVSLSF